VTHGSYKKPPTANGKGVWILKEPLDCGVAIHADHEIPQIDEALGGSPLKQYHLQKTRGDSLAIEHRLLRELLPNLAVVGGGDRRHVGATCAGLLAAAALRAQRALK